MRYGTRAAITLLLTGTTSAFAAATTADAAPTMGQLETVEVSGMQPGPGLWRVSHGEHELWILGLVSPVPKRMQWDASDVTAVINESQLVLRGPSAQIDADAGFFKKISLIPKLMGARRNPGKEKLQDVLPADVYARWQAIAPKYLGRTGGLEKQRPLFVAQELYEEAIDDNGLRSDTGVLPIVEKAAKRAGIEVQQPRLTIKVPDIDALIDDFKATSLDDVACFDQTLTYVERDIPVMRTRANAWATGDIPTLRTMAVTENFDTCLRSLFDAPRLAKHGFNDMQNRAKAVWLDAAEAALKTHRSTFAMLPMTLLLRDDGYVAALRAKGFVVEAPGEASVDDGGDAAVETASP